MRTITSKILNRHGFKVKAVKNGIDALNLLKNDRYNLIMTDFYLPDIEGDKLVLKLKEHSNSPIILITGVQVDNIKKIEGVHAVIKKPIEVDVLLKTIKANYIDLIILDIMLPKMDGYNICRMLKFDAKFKDIPIFMFTARSGESDKTMGEQMGADEYIPKSASMEELEDLVAKINQ